MKFHFEIISTLIFATAILSGCSQNKPIQEIQPITTTKPPTENLSPTKPSEIVELKNGDSYDLTSTYVNNQINGQTYKMLAYNDSIPGPTIKVPQGSEITVNFKNNTDIPNTIHSHGVRLENKFDGVVNGQQPPIEQGQTFAYKIKFPDAGIFWYHPHLSEPYTQSHGLYGAYIVTPTDKNYWSPVNEEVPLILNDINIQNNQLENFNPDVTNYALMGEFGNTMLVNGDANYQKTFRNGEVARFYILNASNTRPYNLTIPNLKMKLVGGDNGKYERESLHSSIILAPSERAIIEVLFNKSGTYILQNANPSKTYNLATFKVTDQKVDQSYANEFQTLRVNQDVIADIDKFRDSFDKTPDKNFTLTLKMSAQAHKNMMSDSAMRDNPDPIEWEDDMQMMNSRSDTDSILWKIIDDQTKQENEQIDWKFKVGDQIKVKIYDDPNSMHTMNHPIHFHGQRFLVLSTNGVKNTNLVWKDTVLVPQGATVEILIDMQNPGTWMAHCHIPEHMASGMMFFYEVKG